MPHEVNERAVSILKRWAILDSKGRAHEVIQYASLDSSRDCDVRRKRPVNWRELSPGELINRVNAFSPQPVKDDGKWWSLD